MAKDVDCVKEGGDVGRGRKIRVGFKVLSLFLPLVKASRWGYESCSTTAAVGSLDAEAIIPMIASTVTWTSEAEGILASCHQQV